MEISNEFLMRAMVVAAVLIAEISREFTFYNNSKIALNSHSVVKMWFRKSYSVSTLDLVDVFKKLSQFFDVKKNDIV